MHAKTITTKRSATPLVCAFPCVIHDDTDTLLDFNKPLQEQLYSAAAALDPGPTTSHKRIAARQELPKK
jgi:hypothetical protein